MNRIEIIMNTSVSIPENVYTYPPEVQESVLQYLHQLSDKEKIAYEIARDHLGTSFHVIKSIGYIEWKARQG